MRKSGLVFVLLGTVTLAVGSMSVVPSVIGLDAAYAKNGGEGGNGGEKGGGEKGGGGGNGKSGERGSSGGEKSATGKSGAAEAGATTAPGKGAAKQNSVATASAKPGKGALASELKGLNAAHASASAFANASDKSRVGQIRSYVEAYTAQTDATADAQAAAAEVGRLAGLTPEQIAAEFPDPVGYDQTTYDAAVAAAEAAEAGGDPTAISAFDDLKELTTEERAAAYPSTWDPTTAYAAAQTAATEAQVLADAEALAAAGLTDEALATAGGANLSPEALAHLHDLLDLPAAESTTETATVEEAAVVE